MPFSIPGSRRSVVLRASSTYSPPSPQQSESGSVTPPSQTYLDTPPVLSADIFDTVPFSASFSTFLNLSARDDTLQGYRDADTTDTIQNSVKDAKRASSRAETSYYVEQLTNIRDVDSEWEDDEVEEVMVISPKPKTSSALVSLSVAPTLPTLPFSPMVEPQGPDVPIILSTPDLSSGVPMDIPSTIVAPNRSMSTLGTEMEVERSVLWTPARMGRLVGHVSPGTTTIASGCSAILSHSDPAPLMSGRPRNPSPPSFLGSPGGGDTPTLQSHQQQEEEQFHRSFFPHLSEVGCGTGVGSSMCIDEFGTFLSENEHRLEESGDSGISPEISLQDALALPIPLLVTPRASEPEVHATPLTRVRLPSRLLRWRSSSGPGAVVHLHGDQEQESPELSWHGLDADPFRCSPRPSVPTEEREASGGECEDRASSRRVDTTFRWSTASLEMGPPLRTREHDCRGRNVHAHAPTLPFALTALTRRLREQGRALLRKSRSNMLLPRPRLPSPSAPSPTIPLLRLPPPPSQPVTSREEVFTLGGGDGGVQRIGLGIGFSLPSRTASPIALQPVYAGREYSEEVVPAGCYGGLGGRRGRKNAPQQQSEQLGGTTRPTQSVQRCESGPGLSPSWELGRELEDGNSGSDEIAAPFLS